MVVRRTALPFLLLPLATRRSPELVSGNFQTHYALMIAMPLSLRAAEMLTEMAHSPEAFRMAGLVPREVFTEGQVCS